jgi:tRNA(adenine34) deaminase
MGSNSKSETNTNDQISKYFGYRPPEAECRISENGLTGGEGFIIIKNLKFKPSEAEKGRERPDDRAYWEGWMAEALDQAREAARQEEVPIGAVLVGPGGERLSAAYNQPRGLADPTAHAEILILRQAARKRTNYRLPGTTVVVTVEPCLMCAGAMIQARVARVVFGALDPKSGALGSLYDLSRDQRLNHRLEVIPGIREIECRELIQGFFKTRR